MSNSKPLPHLVRPDQDRWTGGRQRSWTIAMVEEGARMRADTPHLLFAAVFDVLDDVFNRADRDARRYLDALAAAVAGAPTDATDPLVALQSLATAFAIEARIVDRPEFLRSWHILVRGTISLAASGDLDAAASARTMIEDLVYRHRDRPPLGSASGGAAPTDEFDYELEAAIELHGDRGAVGPLVSDPGAEPMDFESASRDLQFD